MNSAYFQNKKVIITGATGSIGKACSIWLLNQGAKVVLASREMEDLLKIGKNFPNQAICIQTDLSKSDDHQDFIDSAIEALGGLDILINAAGVLHENDLENTCPREHDYLINLNLKSIFSITQLCSLSLAASKGVIVNISSAFGQRPHQGMVSYCMSKAGLDMLTKCLALELSPVRVNAVAPGLVRSRFLDKNVKPEQAGLIKSHYKRKNPLKRLARVDDIVKAVVFLASKATKITGETIVVDGGLGSTSSVFTHWDRINMMNCTLAPSGASGHSLISKWVEQTVGIFVKKDNSALMIKDFMGKSNWCTNLADAHFKITDNYGKIDGEDHHLEQLKNRKDEGGEYYTPENPKPARYLTESKK